MSFHRSSSTFEIIGGQLCADCRNRSGQYRSSSLDLDKHLGNKNGVFEWGGVWFSKSARDVYYINDGDRFILHATLLKMNGAWKESKIDLTDRIANHDGKLVYVGKDEERDGDLIDTDPLAATFSNIRDFAQDLTQSLFGLPSPPINRSRPQSYRANSNQTSHVSSNQPPEEASATHDDIFREIPPEYEESKTPVPTPTAEDASNLEASSSKSPASLTELSAEQQEEFQYELIMRTVKQFLLQGPGATVTSNITNDGQRELVFARGEEKFTLLASKIRPEILFDQEEYRPGSEAESGPPRCLTPETVDGEDEDMVLI